MSRRSYLPAKDLRPPLGTPKQEAAKFLRDMANDFLKERSGENVVTKACWDWLGLIIPLGEPFCPTCNAPVTGNKKDGFEYRGDA